MKRPPMQGRAPMRMRTLGVALRGLGVLVWMLGSATLHAQEPAPGATLESLLAIARQANPELAGMRHEADAAQERVVMAEALMDPRLRIELLDVTRMGSQSPTLIPSDVGSTRYTLTQELPWWGTRALKRDQAGALAQGAQTQVRALWVDLATRIKLVHAQLYFLNSNVALNQEVLDLMQRLASIAQVRYAQGLAAQQDVLRAHSEQTAMRNELIALQGELRMAKARLNALLSRAADAPLAAPAALRAVPAFASLEVAALQARAQANNPQVAAEEARLQAAEKGQALALQGRYPTFTVGIAPTQTQGDFKAWDLMLEMNIPLQQGTRRAQEREAVAMQESARARRDAAINQVLADLAENLAALESARQTQEQIERSLLPQAELTLQAALVGYETAKVDFATVLDAHRQIHLAHQAVIKAQAESQARLAQVERLLGEEQ